LEAFSRFLSVCDSTFGFYWISSYGAEKPREGLFGAIFISSFFIEGLGLSQFIYASRSCIKSGLGASVVGSPILLARSYLVEELVELRFTSGM